MTNPVLESRDNNLKNIFVQDEKRNWFIEQYPLPEFSKMLLAFIENTKEIKRKGSTKGYKKSYTFSTGFTLQNRYGIGAPSKTAYFNWFVVNVYYDTDNHALHVAIQDNEEREVLGKNIGSYTELVAQAQYITLPRKGSVYSFLETSDTPTQQDIEDIYDVFMDLCGRISDIIPPESLTRWNFGDSMPGHIVRKTSHEERALIRKGLTLSLRYKILVRDKSTCQKCWKTVDDGIVPHVDHIQPVSRGGSNEESNLRVLCNTCNIKKNAKLI